MKIQALNRCLQVLFCVFASGTSSYSQKAYPIGVGSLLSKIPMPRSSESCYTASTKSTDAANGAVSITDNGAGYKAVQEQLDKITKAAMTDAMGVGIPTAGAPASADQIEQMKQQAMARAMQAQSMSPQQLAQMHSNPGSSRPGADEIQLIRLVGDAQMACGKINQLTTELSQKMLAVDRSAIENVPMGPNCPDVQQGGYAGPTCACQKQKATTYETKRVAASDTWLQKTDALLQEYLAKLSPLVAQVDDAVARTKYGDALSMPAYKQQVVNIQRMSLNAVTSMMSVAGSAWSDVAKEYAALVNAKSGASSGCFGK